MATTFDLIESATVGSGGAASITFMNTGNIPSTYTDLVLKVSARNTSSGDIFYLSFNGLTSNFTGLYLYWENTTANSGLLARYGGRMNTSSTTASTFASTDIYIPNYATSLNKSYTVDSTSENNAAAAPGSMIAGLWSNASGITSITLTPSTGNFAQYSTAYLYGVKNA